MAKLTKLPGINIINGFKGTIDYYVWMGIPCARSWPKSPGHDRAPAVEAQWPAFTWASKSWQILSPEVIDAYRQMATGTNMTGRDLFIKSFLNGKTLILDEV
ncbi:hypothetical protein ES703_22443 [subsurface metagenome]